jgi:DNA-binding Lrp family transcriptional regulator
MQATATVAIIAVSVETRGASCARALLQVPKIITAYRVLGAFNVVIGVPFASIEQLFELYQEVAKTPGVRQIDLVLYKQFPVWPLNLLSKLVPNLLQELENVANKK